MACLAPPKLPHSASPVYPYAPPTHPTSPCAPPHPTPATLTVRLFEFIVDRQARGWVQKRLVAAFEFETAALEFGGTARCTEEEAAEAAEAEAGWELEPVAASELASA